MISIEAQQKLLLNISKRLKRPLEIYAIGGTAMMFLGFKDATVDIDLVFQSEEDRKIFKKSIEEIGYRKMDSVKVYGGKKNHPEMFTLGDERFDLFVHQVIDFIFSKEMMQRAAHTHRFNSNLILKIADPHDLIIMKCATDRKKDLDDARKIIEKGNINWETLIGEAKNQIKLGKTRAAWELGEFLEQLKDMKLKVPQEVINQLFEIMEKQAEEKQK